MKYLTKRQHKRKKKVEIFNRLEQQQQQQQFYAYHSGNLDLDLEPDSAGTGQEDDDDMQDEDQEDMVDGKDDNEEEDQMSGMLSTVPGKGYPRSSYKSKQQNLIVSSSNSLAMDITYESNHLTPHRRSSLTDTHFHQSKSIGSGQSAREEIEEGVDTAATITDCELECYYHRNKPLTLANFMDMERFGGQQLDTEKQQTTSTTAEEMPLEETEITTKELITAAAGGGICALLGPPVSYARACRSKQKDDQSKIIDSNSYFSNNDWPIIQLTQKIDQVKVEGNWVGQRSHQKNDKKDELSPKTLAVLKNTAFGPLLSMKRVTELVEPRSSVGIRTLSGGNQYCRDVTVINPNEKPIDGSYAPVFQSRFLDNNEMLINKNKKAKHQPKPIGYENKLKAQAAARFRNSHNNRDGDNCNLNSHGGGRGQHSLDSNNWQNICPDPNPNSIVESIKSIWLRDRNYDKDKDGQYDSSNIWTMNEPTQDLNPHYPGRLNMLHSHAGHNLPLYQLNKSHNPTNPFPDYHHSSSNNTLIPPSTTLNSNSNTNFNMFNGNTRCPNRNYNTNNMRMSYVQQQQQQQHHPMRYNFNPQQQHQHNYWPQLHPQYQQQIFHPQQQHLHAAQHNQQQQHQQRQHLYPARFNYKSATNSSNPTNNWLEYMELFPLDLSQEDLTAAQMYAIHGESFFEMPMGKRYKRSLNSVASPLHHHHQLSPHQHYPQQQQSGISTGLGSVALGTSSLMAIRHLTGLRGPGAMTGSMYRSNVPIQGYLGHWRMPTPFNSSAATSGPPIYTAGSGIASAANQYDQMMISPVPNTSSTSSPSAVGVRHALKLNTANFPPLPAPNQKRNQKD